MHPNALQQIPMEQRCVQCKKTKHITALRRSLFCFEEGILLTCSNFTFTLFIHGNIVEKIRSGTIEEELR